MSSSFKARRAFRFVRALTRTLRPYHASYVLCVCLLFLLFISHGRCPLPFDAQDSISETSTISSSSASSLHFDTAATMSRAANAMNATRSRMLGNKFCILQPTLSAGRNKWDADAAQSHIALRAFMRTFIATVTPGERSRFQFVLYYGHDSDDPVFGNGSLRAAFVQKAKQMLKEGGFTENGIKLVFSPMYSLHGRINAIWNVLAKDAYYDGCDYFFLSNDDMVFFTSAWVSRAYDSLNGIGSVKPHKRPCRYLGIVRFKDEWASWATFTFHVSTRLHLEIFGGIYYPVPYYAAHNDFWIHYVYRGVGASKFRGEVKVRNRVEDVDYALAHQKDTKRIALPRYTYDKRGNPMKHINAGRAQVIRWIRENQGTPYCLPPL